LLCSRCFYPLHWLIYWGGGSRRFIYAPARSERCELDANKFQSAVPVAPLGADHIIAFLLHHFYLLYASLVLFSAAELITGLLLMTGLLTRVAALVSRHFASLAHVPG
jgi:thiosulfate dehydrogenase (quinone)